MPILKWLNAKREEMNLNDRDFAAHLGVSQAHWSYLQNGKRKPGNKFRQRVRQVFPEAPADIFLP